jgi:hypothetical protein
MEWNIETLTALLAAGESLVTRVRERSQGDLAFVRPIDILLESDTELADLLGCLETLERAGLAARLETPDANDPTEYQGSVVQGG